MARGLSTRGRFAVAYLLLGAAFGAGIGTFIVLVRRPEPPPPPPWSSWMPGATTMASQLLEIADHVGSAYRLPSGDQLTAIKVGGSQGGQNLRGIAVLNKGAPQKVDQFYDKKQTATYILCGATPNCVIPEGRPSTARGTVLRREALELALYTLKYEQPIDNVLVFFPPAPGQKSLSATLFFHRDDLSSPLKHPLRTTLPQVHPPLPGKISQKEEKTVDDLTGTERYQYLGISQNLVVIRPGG